MQASETQSLLGRKHPGLKDQIHRHLTTTINLEHAYLPLLVCCYTTGLIDAGAYSDWGIFMGMQTGNTIFLALGTASLPLGSNRLQWLRSLTSILSLMAGSLVTGWTYHAAGGTRRLTLSLSFFVQSLCIAIPAFLVTTDAIPQTDPNSDLIFLAIPFLAFQFGAQVATSRPLGYSEIPTTVLTTSYNDLAGDPNVLAWHNPKRNRRAGAIVMLLLGGISGGWLSRVGAGLTLVFWLGAAIKFALGISWLLFRESSEGRNADSS